MTHQAALCYTLTAPSPALSVDEHPQRSVRPPDSLNIPHKRYICRSPCPCWQWSHQAPQLGQVPGSAAWWDFEVSGESLSMFSALSRTELIWIVSWGCSQWGHHAPTPQGACEVGASCALPSHICPTLCSLEDSLCPSAAFPADLIGLMAFPASLAQGQHCGCPPHPSQ